MAGKTADPQLSGYLDAVVSLSGQRDARSLANTMIESVRQRVPSGNIRLLAISSPSKDTEFNENNVQNALVHDWLDPASDQVPVLEDENLLACINTQQQVLCAKPNGNLQRMLLPVFGGTAVIALLEIEAAPGFSDETEALAKLLRVFGNLAFLLSRNELDGLTGLHNRLSFDAHIKQLTLHAGQGERRARGSRGPHHSCLVLLDIDHFKQVNDQYGHLYGDEVLVQLARLMNRSFRMEDLVFRYGGEEFAVVLFGVLPDTATRVLENFRQKVEAYLFPQIGHKTISIGLTAIAAGEIVDTIINRADKALYYAKEHGRNQVCCYETLVAEGKIPPVAVATGDVELF